MKTLTKVSSISFLFTDSEIKIYQEPIFGIIEPWLFYISGNGF